MAKMVNIGDQFRRRRLCFIDIETTGPIFGFHEIIDIAVIRLSPAGNQELVWQKLLKPKFPDRVSPEARKLNGFSVEAWAGAEEADPEIWSSFATIVKDSVAVCQNPSFDRAFISLAASKCGIDNLGLDYHWIGTESLAWPLYAFKLIPDLRLESICAYFKIPSESLPHNALPGARTCLEVYRALMAFYSNSESSLRHLKDDRQHVGSR